MHDVCIFGSFKFKNYDNTLPLDLLLIKEIQFENEIKKNKNKKKPQSAQPNKKKFKNNNSNIIDKNNKKQNNNINLNKKNNYHPIIFHEEKKPKGKLFFNDSKNPNKIMQEIKRIDGLLIWIDGNYNNEENMTYMRLLKENKNKNLIIKPFFNVDDAFEFIFKNNEFKVLIQFRAIYILISGRLYPDYYKKLKERINKIIFLPICCIFTSKDLAEEIEINKITFQEINSPFYNKGGVKTEFNDCIKSFENYSSFYKKLKENKNIKLNNSKKEKNYNEDITFEIIYSKHQMVFPFLFYEIMDLGYNIVPNSDLIKFETFIQKNFNQEVIRKLIIPMLYLENFPRQIVSKFFARMYAEETPFYSKINEALRKNENDYDTFVKAMYEGLYIGSLQEAKDDILYRGSRLSKKEVKNIINSFEEWKKINDKNLPQFLLYSRTILSFSKNEEKIKKFVGITDDNFFGIKYILKYNKNISKKYSSNVDIEKYSRYPEEERIFLPYTTFCLKDIYEKKFLNQKCIFIELDYLGRYEHIFEQFKADEKFQYDFINSLFFYGDNYTIEVINSYLFPKKNDFDDNNNNNERNNLNNDPEKEKKIKFIKKILGEILNNKNELININIVFMDGNKLKIKCRPNITIDEMISHFKESLNIKLTLEEFK